MTPKYVVRLEDGRELLVRASTEAGAKKQANHQEMTRSVIALKRGLRLKDEPSMAIEATRLPDKQACIQLTVTSPTDNLEPSETSLKGSASHLYPVLAVPTLPTLE